MTAIVALDLSNSTFDMIQAVNVLVIDHNKTTEANGVFQANGTIILSGPGTALIVNNAASFASINATTIQATTVIGTNVVVNGVDVLSHANNSYAQANIANNSANTANFRAIGAFAQANAAWATGNTANLIALQSGVIGNTAWGVANTANTVPGSNGDFLYANAGIKFATSKVNINLTSNTVTFTCNLITGDVTSTGNVTASSDRALKSNISPLVNVLPTLRQFEPVSYNLLGSPRRQFGFIAQDIEKLIPELVFGEEGTKSLAYLNIIAYCIAGIKELEQRVKDLEDGKR